MDDDIKTIIYIGVWLAGIGAFASVTLAIRAYLLNRNKPASDRPVTVSNVQQSHYVYKLGIPFEDASRLGDDDIKISAFVFMTYYLGLTETPMQIILDRDIRFRIILVHVVYHGFLPSMQSENVPPETFTELPEVIKLPIYSVRRVDAA